MKYFTKEVKIGLTGIIAIVILYFGVSFLKGINMFSGSHNYFITFKNAKGLSASSPVYADGYKIGIVRAVSYDFDKPGQVLVEINVDDDVRIPQGTTASLSEGMLGGCTLNLTLGTNPKEVIATGATIVGSDNNGLMAQAEQMLPQVSAVIEHVDSLINTLNRVANDPNIPQMLGNAEQITANLNVGTKQLNTLLQKDIPQMMGTFDRVGKNAERLTSTLNTKIDELDVAHTMAQVNQTINDVQQLIRMMEDPNGNLGLILKDSMLYHNLNTTIGSANNLLLDLKAHPKRYVHFSIFGRKDN